MKKTTKKLRVKKWFESGELDSRNLKQDDILDECGRLLDKAYSHEILGQTLFQATDGKYYTITVEAVISEANPEYVKDLLTNPIKEAQ